MSKVIRFWKLVILDTLGVLFMVGAVLTGWLPGPGGIPLFIVGLSLFAIHHDWAKRYIKFLRKYADKLGDYIFARNPKVQLIYDVLVPLTMGLGIYLLWLADTWWVASLGMFFVFMSLTVFLGNRQRWPHLKAWIKHKH